jgi:hypothetical protein
MKDGFGKAVSRILSALLRAERIICLSSHYPGPARFRETWSGQLQGPLFGLAPDGVCRASSLTLRAVVSYTTFSPLPESLRTQAVYSLWYFPSGRLTASPPACIPKSAFLRRRLQVTRHRALWSSDFPPPSRRSGTEAILRLSKTIFIIPRNPRGATTETSKLQVPTSREIPNSKRQGADGCFGIEAWSFSGTWILGFGGFNPPLPNPCRGSNRGCGRN